MTELTVTLSLKERLKSKLEELEDKDLPESMLTSMRSQVICDTIAEYIAERAMDLSVIEDTILSYGSGDAGNQTVLNLKPDGDVSKETLRDVGEQLNDMLSAGDPEIFPASYIISIVHDLETTEEGNPSTGDSFYIQLAYRVRTGGKPQVPPQVQNPEIITKRFKE